MWPALAALLCLALAPSGASAEPSPPVSIGFWASLRGAPGDPPAFGPEVCLEKPEDYVPGDTVVDGRRYACESWPLPLGRACPRTLQEYQGRARSVPWTASDESETGAPWKLSPAAQLERVTRLSKALSFRVTFKHPGYRPRTVDVPPSLFRPGTNRFPASGAVELDPLLLPITFGTYPSGAQVFLRHGTSLWYLGRSGTRLYINFAQFVDAEQHAYAPETELVFRLEGFAPSSQRVSVQALAQREEWPDPKAEGAEAIALHETVPGSRLYYWAVRDHPVLSATTGLLLVVATLWLLARWRRMKTRLRKAALYEHDVASLDRADPLVGTYLGRYRLLERVGTGGMASVYRAIPGDQDYEEVRTTRDFRAVKIMRSEYAKDEDYRRRFLREVKVSRSLNHPHIIRVYDDGEQEGLLYLVTEFLDGRNLADEIPVHGMSTREALRVLRPIFEAVRYAHGRGVVHRDLKPANIMRSLAGQVKVMDFGLARLQDLSRLTPSGDLIGTPAYMSPEQIGGHEASAASDQYALGVLTYEVLCGQVPFWGDEPVAIAMKHLNEDPPPIRSLRADLPAEISGVLQRMLAKAPAERYPSVEAALQALEWALSHR